jgi:WD40 repeat protein
MNPSDLLTDELIQAAFERRARRADPGDLRETIVALSAASSQRSPWRLQLRSTMSAPLFSPASLKGVVAATVIGVIAVGAGFFVMRSGEPTVGGPSPTLNATSSPSSSASPSAGPSVAVVAPRAPAWTATGGMITPRDGHMATLLLDGRVLVVGGPIETISPSNSAELYDPATGKWAATGSMLAPRFEYTATLLPDGKVLVAGGSNNTGELASAELYDPIGGTWTATGAMATGRFGHTATLLPDGKVLVAAGSHDGFPDGPTAELYDPISGTWTATGAMATERYEPTATLLPDGRVLVAGGTGRRSPGPTPAELYDPASGTWTATGAVAARACNTATLLPNGNVLVAGGRIVHGPDPLASAELYDPQSGAWSATQAMVAPRSCHTATLLPDGRVLVAGGAGGADTSAPDQLASAELYDPASGTWSATASMVAERSSHTATLLPDGRVLVASGNGLEIGIGGVVLASAELYDPGSEN